MAAHNSGRVVRHAHWAAKLALSGREDTIVVQRLDATVNAGTDVWGRRKTQRAAVTVTLTLDRDIASASATDSVDDSTVHYGVLSKAIRGRLHQEADAWLSTTALAALVMRCVADVSGATKIYAAQVDVCYPKGSMFGHAGGLVASRIDELAWCSYLLYLRDIQVPCIIGVNANERLQKQPVVLNVWIDCVPEHRHDDHAALESFVFNRIADTSFQTIESLLTWLVEELRQHFFTEAEDQDAWIRLRIEKPLAVPFADAPAVEITRPVRLSVHSEGQ